MFFLKFSKYIFSDFEQTILQRAAQNAFSVSKAIKFKRFLAHRANVSSCFV